ncbi:MAG TPA: PLP-dependent aminotransferase family protein [Gaiellaceae bacterium]|nr:PLP-dependent aminotransferase family protein [Gaiellaceae bacterium]
MDQLTTSSKAPELLLGLDRGSGRLSAQLERELREAVRSGRLKAGTRLPSTRALAGELGISRGLVVAAYAQLGAEGYLRLRRNAPPLVADAIGAPERPRTLAADPYWRYNLRPDLPDFAAFPREEWLTSYRAALKTAPDQELAYGDVRGTAALRQALAAYLGRARGVVGDAEHIFVCAGFAQAVGLVGGVLARAGRRRVAVEDPCHAVIRELVARSGVEPVPLPVDDEGIAVDALERAAPDAVLVTPAHQFPTGVVLSPERRSRVLAWAERADAIVIEDDYDAEFRYDRPPVGALQGLAPGRVMYCGSASKTLAPTLRLGWVVAPPRLVRELVDQVLYTAIAPPRLEQLALADFLGRGELDRHLRRMRLRYRRRRDELVRSLERELPDVEVRGVAAGLYVAAVLPPGTDERRVLEEARRRGVGVYGMSEHCARVTREPALLLGYAVSSEPAIRAGIRKLAEAVRAASA